MARRETIDLHELQRISLMAEVEEERRSSGPPPPRSACGPGGGCRPGVRAESSRENFVGQPRGLPPRARAIAPPRAQFSGSRSSTGGLPADWETYTDEPAGDRGRLPGSSEPPRENSRELGLNVHELLKKEMFESPIAACDDHFEKNRPCPSGVYGVSDQYVILDTFHKLRTSDISRGTYQWNFMVQGVTGDEVIGVKDKMSTVIAIQLGPFSMPILPEVEYILRNVPAAPTGTDQIGLYQNNSNAVAPFNPLLPANQYPQSIPVAPITTVNPWVNNPYTQFPSYGRFTIQIREAGLQSYSDGNGARHHYDYTLSTTANSGGTNPNMLAAVPQSGAYWDTFIFTDPLEYVHGVTLIFRNPDVPIRFLPDCLYDITVESDGSAYPGPFLRVRAPGFNLNWGDRIVIRGFQSGNLNLDSLMNRADGFVAAGDPQAAPVTSGTPITVAGDPDVFYTDPAVSIHDLTVVVPVLPQIIDVCIAKRRMRIPARFRCMVSRLSNYLAP